MTDLPEIRKVVDKAFAKTSLHRCDRRQCWIRPLWCGRKLSDRLSTNLFGPIQLVRAALPHLRAQGGGRIIGLSTYGGQAALPGSSLYHASKRGLEGFLDSIAQELAPFNIGVTIIEPGGARTNFRLGGAQIEAYQGTPAAMVHTIDQRYLAPAPWRSRKDGKGHRRQH